MKNPFAIAVCACVLPLVVAAQDIVHMTDGTRRNLKILGVEGDGYIVSLPSPVPGQPPARTTIKRATVSRIIFGPDALLDTVAANVGPGSLATARVRWQSLQPFLGIPESRAGEAGCLYGEILLGVNGEANQNEALSVFKAVEAGTWNPADRQRATRGRLAVMMKQGHLEEAVQEAEQIERTAEEPDLVIETKLLLAEARKEALRALLADNPRWDQDPPVRTERARLIHEGVDLSLFPFLFHGTKRAQAARGLWIAHEIYELAGQDDDARNVATDLTAIYSETPEAEKAAALDEKKS